MMKAALTGLPILSSLCPLIRPSADGRLTRREFLTRASAGAAGLTGGLMLEAGRVASASAPGGKLNVVFILIDDLGWPDLGCYGHRFHETPHIDRLAKEGMRFTDAYAAAPVCSPTRASILAGQYPARLGITDFIPGHQRPWARLDVPVNRQQYLPTETVTIPEALAPAGYVAGAFGKWHLGGRDFFPDRQGFDSMLVSVGRHFKFRTTPPIEHEDGDYLAEVLTDHAEAFLDTHADRPFLLYLSHYAVHIPLEAREALIAKYANKTPPARPSGGVNHPVYAAMVEHVDRSVGRILEKLRQLGLEDRTVVFLASDNGGLRKRFDGQGPVVSTNAPLRDEKGTLYEGGIRVPLIVRWPRVVQGGSVCRVPVSSVDFYPTILEMAGVSGDDKHVLDGVSLVPLLEASSLSESRAFDRDALFWHYPHYHHSTPASAIRQGNWKLIEFYEDGRLELYNLGNDLAEQRNLADEMPEKAAALREKLAAWRTSVGAAMPQPNPDFDPARAHEWKRR